MFWCSDDHFDALRTTYAPAVTFELIIDCMMHLLVASPDESQTAAAYDPCPGRWPPDDNGGFYFWAGSPRVVTWVQIIGLDNMRSTLVLLATLYLGTQRKSGWDDDTALSVAWIGKYALIFDPADQDLTRPPNGHAFLSFQLTTCSDGSVVCRVVIGPAEQWDDEMRPDSDAERATRRLLYRRTMAMDCPSTLDHRQWAEFLISADTWTLTLQDAASVIPGLRADEPIVRDRIRAALDRVIGGPVAAVAPGVSDDDTDVPLDNEDHPETGGQYVAVISEQVVTRIPHTSYLDAPNPYAQRLANEADRQEFIDIGMQFFHETFGRAQAANDPTIIDRTVRALGILHDDICQPSDTNDRPDRD
jgi:hypothetical protein